jgi:plastocyanin
MRLRLLVTTSLAAASLLVGSDHAAAGGGGCADEPPMVPVASTQVAMSEGCFRPGVVSITPGETLRIQNKDAMLHNIYGPGWFPGDLPPGDTMSRTFDEAGTYTFGCTLHPGMTGAVVVGDVELIAAISPAAEAALADQGAPVDDDTGSPLALLAAVGLALVIGFGSGATLGLTTGRRSRASRPTASL